MIYTLAWKLGLKSTYYLRSQSPEAKNDVEDRSMEKVKIWLSITKALFKKGKKKKEKTIYNPESKESLNDRRVLVEITDGMINLQK